MVSGGLFALGEGFFLPGALRQERLGGNWMNITSSLGACEAPAGGILRRNGVRISRSRVIKPNAAAFCSVF